MSARAQSGKEGELRARYVEQLETAEAQLRGLDEQEASLKTTIEQTKADIAVRLKTLV
jgi:multidrug resistance efflux pump